MAKKAMNAGFAAFLEKKKGGAAPPEAPPAKGKAGAQKVFRLGEFFCGPGGIGLGAIKSQVSSNGVTYSFAHAWANDFDPDTCETYRRNICPREPESVVCGDIRKIDPKQFGQIEAFAYGFPCNDFSIVGEHKGFDGEFGPLYSYGVRIIDRLKPKIIFAETPLSAIPNA